MKRARRHHGQQAINSDRTRQIQAALIREKYLDGEPSGVWDERTQNAMMRYQKDNGWQTKIMPDSRALIKMGLGPNYEGDLGGNPISSQLSHLEGSNPEAAEPVQH